jgi:hypothetical protein
LEELKKNQAIVKDNTKIAIKKLTNVDNFIDDLWNKVENKELSKALTDLRDAINLLN